MRANIIRIRNSHGIRLPKVILKQSRLGNEVDLEVEPFVLAILPPISPAAQFRGWMKPWGLFQLHKNEIEPLQC